VSNSAPSVTISSPANASSYASGAAVTFTGSANDAQDGLLTSALAWTSNIDGSIGLGGSFTKVLSPGSHTIKATVVDNGGMTTVKQVSVTVTSSNTAPSVTISSPASGANYASGTAVSFSGSASDAQDGSLTAALAWTSSIDGAIGSGASFTKVLTAGSHTIKATATDNGGLSTVKQITVTVNALTSGGTLKATGRKTKGSQSVELSWSGLSGTSLDVFRDSTKWTTPNDGAEVDPINRKGGGTYSYKVCAAGTTTCSNTATVTF
jgi:chitodextrinase